MELKIKFSLILLVASDSKFSTQKIKRYIYCHQFSFQKKGQISRENNTMKNLPHSATIFCFGAVFHQFSKHLMPINTEYFSGQLLNHDATTSQNLGKSGR